jgi:hypothetical protein
LDRFISNSFSLLGPLSRIDKTHMTGYYKLMSTSERDTW